MYMINCLIVGLAVDIGRAGEGSYDNLAIFADRCCADRCDWCIVDAGDADGDGLVCRPAVAIRSGVSKAIRGCLAARQ